MNETKSRYDILTTRVEQLSDAVGALKDTVNVRRAELQRLQQFVAGMKTANAFTVCESEINSLIGQWGAALPLSGLLEKLRLHDEKIKQIDQATSELKAKHQQLVRMPDRHNRKEVTDKMEIFFKNVPNIRLEQLDIIKNQIIPSICAMIEKVDCGFNAENSAVEKNKEVALRLKDRVDGYSTNVDRFGLHQLCTQARKLAERVIQSPNAANPGMDQTSLNEANVSLDKCMAQFAAEEDKFNQLEQTIEDNRHEMWREDYEAITEILHQGPYDNATPAEQLQQRYREACETKKNAIDQVVNKYSPSVRSKCSSMIEKLRTTPCYKRELSDLISELDYMAAVEKKKKLMLTLKIAGVVIGVLALVVATIVWGWWVPVTLLIIAGAVFYFIFY